MRRTLRLISEKEWKQRGCEYCLDHQKHSCKHDECPYHELDNVETYEEYMQNMGFFFDSLLTDVFDCGGIVI